MKPKIERQTVFYLKWILISLVTLILVQTLYTAHLQKANLYLKHEVHKQKNTKIIEIDKNCEICNPCENFTDIKAQ